MWVCCWGLILWTWLLRCSFLGLFSTRCPTEQGFVSRQHEIMEALSYSASGYLPSSFSKFFRVQELIVFYTDVQRLPWKLSLLYRHRTPELKKQGVGTRGRVELATALKGRWLSVSCVNLLSQWKPENVPACKQNENSDSEIRIEHCYSSSDSSSF